MVSTTGRGRRRSPSSSGRHYNYMGSFISGSSFLLLILQQVSAWTNYNSSGRTVISSSRCPRISNGLSTAMYSSSSSSSSSSSQDDNNNIDSSSPSLIQSRHEQFTITNRRDNIQQILQSTTSTLFLATAAQSIILPAAAYTPDANPLRESLYLMSRVQEATVQQERFVNRATQQDVLKSKMKLTLRLVEKNYRILDQITYCSEYITPSDKVVEATAAGYEAAEALQNVEGGWV